MRDDVRRELLRAAARRQTVTYGSLMQRFHLSRSGTGLVRVLGEIDREETRANAPGFAAIVVREDTGYPGGGFFCWTRVPASLRRPEARGSDPRLSDAETSYVRGIQEEVWAFYGKEPLAHGKGSVLGGSGPRPIPNDGNRLPTVNRTRPPRKLMGYGSRKDNRS